MQQYELINLIGMETAENRKLFRKLARELLQLKASFTVLSRKTIMLTYEKNSIFTTLQLKGKIAVLQDRFTQIEFDIKNM